MQRSARGYTTRLQNSCRSYEDFKKDELVSHNRGGILFSIPLHPNTFVRKRACRNFPTEELKHESSISARDTDVAIKSEPGITNNKVYRSGFIGLRSAGLFNSNAKVRREGGFSHDDRLGNCQGSRGSGVLCNGFGVWVGSEDMLKGGKQTYGRFLKDQ